METVTASTTWNGDEGEQGTMVVLPSPPSHGRPYSVSARRLRRFCRPSVQAQGMGYGRGQETALGREIVQAGESGIIRLARSRVVAGLSDVGNANGNG